MGVVGWVRGTGDKGELYFRAASRFANFAVTMCRSAEINSRRRFDVISASRRPMRRVRLDSPARACMCQGRCLPTGERKLREESSLRRAGEGRRVCPSSQRLPYPRSSKNIFSHYGWSLTADPSNKRKTQKAAVNGSVGKGDRAETKGS